jgi:hypothetical protein
MFLSGDDKQLTSKLKGCLDRIDNQDAVATITKVLHSIPVQSHSPFGSTVAKPTKSENASRAEVERSLVQSRNNRYQINYFMVPAADGIDYGLMCNSRSCELPLERKAIYILECYLSEVGK